MSGGVFYDKSIVFLTLLVLAGCVPPAEESEEENTQNQAMCEVASDNSITTGEELVANFTCKVSTIYQGKKLDIAYDESLTSLKLVVSKGEETEETVGQGGELAYILPRQEQFQAKLKLTGVTAGTGQLQFKILREESNWDFTVIQGGPEGLTLGAAVTSTAFTKMQDTAGKAYGRSVMRLDTSQTLVSNDEAVCEDTPLNALLVSSDDFVTCEKVFVQKGVRTSHLIIPKQTWGLNKTYKVAVKTAGGASAFNRSGNPVSFTTNNANHNTTAHITGFDVGQRPKVLRNHFHLEKDGELWYYINKGDLVPRYDASECRTINYKAADDTQFKNLNSGNSADRDFARAVFGNTSRFYIGSFTGGFNVLRNHSNGVITRFSTGTIAPSDIHYFCSMKIPERA